MSYLGIPPGMVYSDIWGWHWPERRLPCGCLMVNGAIMMVSEMGEKVNTDNLYSRPGKTISVDGPAHSQPDSGYDE